jgi:hypothetical protein
MATKNFREQQKMLRKQNAIDRFVSIFKGRYEKQSPDDIDYKVFDNNNNLICYVEIRELLKNISRAYPLPIPASKVTKLWNKRLNPTIVWACDDGIIYGKLEEIEGVVGVSGRVPKSGSLSEVDLIVYYDKQKSLKYVRYV